jgi:hypothetical protein
MSQKTKPRFGKDRLAFLGQSFSVEFPLTPKECIDRMEDEATSYPLGKPKKSGLELAAIDDSKWLFTFDGLSNLQSLRYTGIIEQISTHRTNINGFARLSDSALLRNSGMVVLSLIFIRLPYLSVAFFIITALSIYFDVMLSKNAAQKFEKVILNK